MVWFSARCCNLCTLWGYCTKLHWRCVLADASISMFVPIVRTYENRTEKKNKTRTWLQDFCLLWVAIDGNYCRSKNDLWRYIAKSFKSPVIAQNTYANAKWSWKVKRSTMPKCDLFHCSVCFRMFPVFFVAPTQNGSASHSLFNAENVHVLLSHPSHPLCRRTNIVRIPFAYA